MRQPAGASASPSGLWPSSPQPSSMCRPRLQRNAFDSQSFRSSDSAKRPSDANACAGLDRIGLLDPEALGARQSSEERTKFFKSVATAGRTSRPAEAARRTNQTLTAKRFPQADTLSAPWAPAPQHSFACAQAANFPLCRGQKAASALLKRKAAGRNAYPGEACPSSVVRFRSPQRRLR